MKYLYTLLIVSLFVRNSNAQEGNFDTEDSLAFNTLALYPLNVRQLIFKGSLHPELLLKTQELQKKTSKRYQDLLFDYFKSEQEKFWELSRHNGLIEKIVVGGRKSTEELTAIASLYPSEIRETIISYGKKFYIDLEEIYRLNKKSEKEFDSLLRDYPDSVQIALKELVKQPEIIGLLCDNMKVTVTLGDLYKTRAKYLNAKMDSISLVNAEQKVKELENWKNGLESNPEAKTEMLKAAQEFSKEQGQKEDYYTVENINVNYVVEPYPYWFGYPWWYHYPYWYPRPYWYDWGFYAGPGGFVYIGLPSPFFTHWYFSNHHHHYYYNHFSDYCIGHYYGHRNSHGGFNKELHLWTKVNENQLPRDFLKNDGKRAERLKAVGSTANINGKPLRYAPKVYSKENYRIQFNKAPKEGPVKTNPVRTGKSPTVKPKPEFKPTTPRAVPQNRPPVIRGRTKK